MVQIETEKPLSALLPLWTTGEVAPESINALRSLTLLREDKSLYHYDLFNPAFSLFNALIIGTSGKGKSVLTGLLSHSLLRDPKNRIIKVDVKGSHSKECEVLGGLEYEINLGAPSGINPLEIINSHSISPSDKVSIVSGFLTTLIREQNEPFLSKNIKAEVERNIREYVDSEPESASLFDFYIKSPDFPRREILSRWVKGGVYEAAFAEEAFAKKVECEQPVGDRLRYYNYSNIFQAADEEFAQAGIAAVLAQFNYELLRDTDSNLVLIFDETPFFVKICFDFFKFTTANIRKHGAIVLIAQLSSDLIVNGDVGLIENSPQRFLFSADGEDDAFRARFGLSYAAMKSLKNLRSSVGNYSEVLFQTEEKARKLTVKVTREEYWRLTTSKIDREKLMQLIRAVRGLSLKQAIQCLSMER